MSDFDDELRKVHAKQRAAMDAQAAQGSTQQGVLEAALRAALDHAVGGIDPDLAVLEELLGEKVDAGAFFLGAQAIVLSMQGVNAHDVVGQFAPMFREYMARARER